MSVRRGRRKAARHRVSTGAVAGAKHRDSFRGVPRRLPVEHLIIDTKEAENA